MSHYIHLSTLEREMIGELHRNGAGVRAIADELGRSPESCVATHRQSANTMAAWPKSYTVGGEKLADVKSY